MPFIKIQLQLHLPNHTEPTCVPAITQPTPIFCISLYPSPSLSSHLPRSQTFSSKLSFVYPPHLVPQDLLLVLTSGAEVINPLVHQQKIN